MNRKILCTSVQMKIVQLLQYQLSIQSNIYNSICKIKTSDINSYDYSKIIVKYPEARRMQMSYFWLDKCVAAEVVVVADDGNPKLKIWVSYK